MDKKKTEKLLYNLKHEIPSEIPSVIPIQAFVEMFQLRVVTRSVLTDNHFIKFLNDWRKKNQEWFPSQFPVSVPRTKRWAKEQVLEKPDRILFFIENKLNGKPIGHMGLYRFDYQNGSLEIDNVIRGVDDKDSKGVMTEALSALISWTNTYIKPKKLLLSVFLDNKKAVSLYERVGFTEQMKIPLAKTTRGGITYWEETNRIPTRYNLKMILK